MSEMASAMQSAAFQPITSLLYKGPGYAQVFLGRVALSF